MRPISYSAFILLLFLSSCYTPQQFVNVQVTYSPKAVFNPVPASVLLINQFDVSKTKITNEKKRAVINAGAYSAIKYAEGQLKDLPNVTVINAVDSEKFVPNTDSIKFLASKYNVNYVLALKDFRADIIQNFDANLNANYNTNVETDFVLYAADGIYYKKLNGKSEDPRSEVIYPGVWAALILRPTIKGSKAYIATSAQSATQQALADYLPDIVKHNRPLFNDEPFQPAIKELTAGNYDKADTLFQPFLIDKNPVTVCKAAYNLSVVYESEGDISLAIDMAKLSLAKRWNQYATEILADLEQE